MQKRRKFGWTRAQTVLIRKTLKSRQTERSAKERLPHAIGENDQASPSCPSATKFPAPSPNQVQTVSNTIRPPRAPPAVENAPDFLVTTTCHTPPAVENAPDFLVTTTCHATSGRECARLSSNYYVSQATREWDIYV